MRQMTCCSSLTWLKLLVDLFSNFWQDADSETPASRSGESHPGENRCKVWATIFGINAGRAIAKVERLRSFIASNFVFWCLEVPLTAKPSAPINARLPIGRWEGSERSRNVRCVFRPKSRRLSGPRPPRLECNSCRHPRSRVYPLA